MDEAIDELREEEKNNAEETHNIEENNQNIQTKDKQDTKLEDKNKDAIGTVVGSNKKKQRYPNGNVQEKEDEKRCYLNHVKIEKNKKDFPNEIFKKYIISYGYFNCGEPEKNEKGYEIDGKMICPEYMKHNHCGDICSSGELSCPECMKLNRKYYGLRPNYLVNERGRICTFKNNKIYCNKKLTKEEFIKGIKYTYEYVCGHSGQCEPCQNLTKLMDKYFDPDLVKKLRKRDCAKK